MTFSAVGVICDLFFFCPDARTTISGSRRLLYFTCSTARCDASRRLLLVSHDFTFIHWN
jgi:hypothetical protein